MTDYYKISLEILYRLLKDSGDNHWANWISKDLDDWSSSRSVNNHLSAFGGMGSINDLAVGKANTIGAWKNQLFGIIKNLSWSLAKGKITSAPLDPDFYKSSNNELSGWRCLDCGHARIDKVQLEYYLSAKYLPLIIVDLIKDDKLIEISDLTNFVNLDYIDTSRKLIEKQVIENGYALTSGNEWLRTCPNCNKNDVCVYRWTFTDSTNTLIESNNNLRIKKGQLTTRNIANGGESSSSSFIARIKRFLG